MYDDFFKYSFFGVDLKGVAGLEKIKGSLIKQTYYEVEEQLGYGKIYSIIFRKYADEALNPRISFNIKNSLETFPISLKIELKEDKFKEDLLILSENILINCSDHLETITKQNEYLKNQLEKVLRGRYD